ANLAESLRFARRCLPPVVRCYPAPLISGELLQDQFRFPKSALAAAAAIQSARALAPYRPHQLRRTLIRRRPFAKSTRSPAGLPNRLLPDRGLAQIGTMNHCAVLTFVRYCGSKADRTPPPRSIHPLSLR